MGDLFLTGVVDDHLYYCPECETKELMVNWSEDGSSKCNNLDCGFAGSVTACELEDCFNTTRGRGEVFVCSDCIELHV
ncbi:hypothetical protein [Paenibacillus crassostreae]|uniref:Uncharacterized protein n=1 Tax=Paenibacillus crassostreae TaxID=1763538 RepID=A0A167EIH5_9BACL|nr:hypothetical protein [Paenibacillus crassostreae]AOZ94893.1 hypothetical protein LPB68_21780 [Paenibacillus crassostreae]OAB75576.1 hypothetical protein PNBC_08070 [Paenibacillus crassostreae]